MPLVPLPSKLTSLSKIQNGIKITSKLKWCDAGLYLFIKKLNYCVIVDDDRKSISIFEEEYEHFQSESTKEIIDYINKGEN